MSNEKYELLMREMDSIAKKIERFPDSLKKSAFEKMVDALFNESNVKAPIQETNNSIPSAASEQSVNDEREDDNSFSSNILDFYDRAGGSTCNDMEFATLSAHFYEKEARHPYRRATIGPDQLEKMCRITRRRVPANCRSTLNNAKNHKKYLESHGKGLYMLTESGKEFVNRKLNPEVD